MNRVYEIGLKSALQLLADKDLRWAEKLFSNMVYSLNFKTLNFNHFVIKINFRALMQIQKSVKYSFIRHIKN